MKHETADKLVYCHEALHLEQKNLDASWEADIERWDSDNDSGNESAGEAGDGDFSAELELQEEEILALCA